MCHNLSIKADKRNTLFCEIKDWCIFSKEHDFIEVTEWSNGDGVDIVIDSAHFERISLTWGNGDY